MSEQPPKTTADNAELETAVGFLKLLIKAVRKHQEAVTHNTLVTSALLQAIAEKLPEVGDSYARYLAEAEKSSPVAETSRQIIAELDRLTANMKTD
jgi:hypothetical protein